MFAMQFVSIKFERCTKTNRIKDLCTVFIDTQSIIVTLIPAVKKVFIGAFFFSRYKISVPDHDARMGSRVPRPDSYCLSLAQGYRVSLVTQTHGGYKRVTLP